MQIGNKNYLMKNDSVSNFSCHRLTAYEMFLSHLHDKHQWLSFGSKFSQDMSFVAMEMLVGANERPMHILTKPPKEIKRPNLTMPILV